MKKSERIRLSEVLEKTLVVTNEMFTDSNVEKAYIVGYLQGTIKHIISELKG